MHVFVTGATGWVGSAVVDDLIEAGHTVTGLARDPEKAAALAWKGAHVVRARLEDDDALRDAAAAADAVIHTAFNHDFAKFLESAALDQHVIATLGGALAGSRRPLLVTSGLLGLPRGATEADIPNPAALRKSEVAVRALTERGVRAATVRLAPSVHGLGDFGFVPMLIRMAREKGVSAYIDDGANAWAGVHRTDAARVYRLALEQGMTEQAYHAVADESVPFKEIAKVIGRRLGLPVESRPAEHFGWFAHFAGTNLSASAERTRSLLGWKPKGPDLIADIDQPGYFAG